MENIDISPSGNYAVTASGDQLVLFKIAQTNISWVASY